MNRNYLLYCLVRKVKSKSKVKSRISRLHIKEGYVGSSMKVMDRLGDVRYMGTKIERL